METNKKHYKKDSITLLHEAVELSKVEKVTDANFDGIDNIKSPYLYIINKWGGFYRYINQCFREGIAIYSARIFKECLSGAFYLRIVLGSHNIDIDLYDYFTICKKKDDYGFLGLYIDYIKNIEISYVSKSDNKEIADNYSLEKFWKNVDEDNNSNTSNSFYDSIDPATKAMLDKVCKATFNNINEVFNYFQFMYAIKVDKSFIRAERTFRVEIYVNTENPVIILDKTFHNMDDSLEYLNNFDANVVNDVIIWNVCTYILTNSIA